MLVKRSLQLRPNWKKFDCLPIICAPNKRATSDRDTLLHRQSVWPRTIHARCRSAGCNLSRAASCRQSQRTRSFIASRVPTAIQATPRSKFSMQERPANRSASVNRASCLKISTVPAVRSPRRITAKTDSQHCLRREGQYAVKFSQAICASDCARVWSRRQSRKHSALPSSR